MQLISALIGREQTELLFLEQLPREVNSKRFSSVDIIRRDSPQIHLVLRQFRKLKFHPQSCLSHVLHSEFHFKTELKFNPDFLRILRSIDILIREEFLKWVLREFQGDQLLSRAPFPISNIEY